MKSIGSPVRIVEGKSVSLKQKHIDEDTPLDERWLQELVFKHPEAIPMEQIEPDLGELIPVCLELPLRCGFLDNLYATPDGDLVVVEVKLWRNHEMRRSVMAQVLDYASAMFDLSYEQLDDAVKSAERSGGRSLFEIVKTESPEALEEPVFIDAVSHNLRTGRIVVLVVGDGIRSELETLNQGLQVHAGFQFTFGMVELTVYEPTKGDFLLVPRTLAKTHLIDRGIVSIEGPIDQIRLRPPQAAASTKPKQTMTRDAFLAEMAEIDPELPGKIRTILSNLEPFGVYGDYGQASLILRWPYHAGKKANLAEIHRKGRVWTDKTLNSLGNTDHAQMYLQELASGINGKVDMTKKSPYVTLNGSAPDIRTITDRPSVLTNAVKSLVERTKN